MSSPNWPLLPSICPACGHRSETSTSAGTEATPPKDGDFAVCFRCGEVMVFSVSAFGSLVREATMDEVAEFAQDPKNTTLVQSLIAFHAQRGDLTS